MTYVYVHDCGGSKKNDFRNGDRCLQIQCVGHDSFVGLPDAKDNILALCDVHSVDQVDCIYDGLNALNF